MALGVMAAVAQDRLVPAMRNLVSFLRVDRLARWVDADPIPRLVVTRRRRQSTPSLKISPASDHIGSADAWGARHPWKRRRHGQRTKVLPPCAPHGTRGSKIANDQRSVRFRNPSHMRASHRSDWRPKAPDPTGPPWYPPRLWA